MVTKLFTNVPKNFQSSKILGYLQQACFKRLFYCFFFDSAEIFLKRLFIIVLKMFVLAPVSVGAKILQKKLLANFCFVKRIVYFFWTKFILAVSKLANCSELAGTILLVVFANFCFIILMLTWWTCIFFM